MVDRVPIVFQLASGADQPVDAEVGASLLQVAQEAGLEVEGACEGNMACATCHMIFAGSDHDQLPPASEEESEMLDLAVGLTATSRLGCQIIVTPDMRDWRITLPEDAGSMMGF